MFWLDKENSNVLFCDIRTEAHILCDGRTLNITPDLEMDFTDMPFPDNKFKLIVFDPPHMNKLGKNSWMAKKYGVLGKTWQEDISRGFSECMRVLDYTGTLIFKWNESQIKEGEIMKLIPYKPLVHQRAGKGYKTIWMVFYKEPTT